MGMPSTIICLETEILEDLVARGWRYLFHFQSSLLQEKHARAIQTNQHEELSALQNHLHQQHKRLYRDSLKLCHPDVIAPHLLEHAQEWMRQTRQAYEAGNGCRLTVLHRNIRRLALPHAEFLHSLRQEYLRLQWQVSHARAALQQFRHCPVYKLQQRNSYTTWHAPHCVD